MLVVYLPVLQWFIILVTLGLIFVSGRSLYVASLTSQQIHFLSSICLSNIVSSLNKPSNANPIHSFFISGLVSSCMSLLQWCSWHCITCFLSIVTWTMRSRMSTCNSSYCLVIIILTNAFWVQRARNAAIKKYGWITGCLRMQLFFIAWGWMILAVKISKEHGGKTFHRDYSVWTFNYIGVMLPYCINCTYYQKTSRVLVPFKNSLPQHHFLQHNLQLCRILQWSLVNNSHLICFATRLCVWAINFVFMLASVIHHEIFPA